MRPSVNLRKSRPLHVGAGALMFAIPASAVALATGQADAQGALEVTLKSDGLGYGDDVIALGTAPSTDAGHTAQLQFAPHGSASWRTLATSKVRGDGHFRIVAPLHESGLVRVTDATSAAPARAIPVNTVPTTVSTVPTALSTDTAASAAQPVAVGAAFRLADASFDVLAGQPIQVRGRLLPAVGGRTVRLQAGSGGHWRTLASARTGPRGGFKSTYTPGSTGQQQLRVRFPGDGLNSGASMHVGQLTVYRQSVASWYDDGGSTACGFHATYGVANRTLPCGTKVTFRYNGRSVTATVDDRGPFVGGRDWDLNQNTAATLGFGGVDTVWSSA
jgi:hypothetical protein